MNFDLDKAMEKAPQWRLSLTIGGREWPIRKPDAQQLAALERARLGKLLDEEIAPLLGSLIEGDADVAQWPLDVWVAALGAILAYLCNYSARVGAATKPAIDAAFRPAAPPPMRGRRRL